MSIQLASGFLLLAAFCFLSVVSPVPAQENAPQEDIAKIESFRDLLQPGDAVYLRAPAEKSLYQIQLLSGEQAAAIQEQEQDIAAKRERLEKIDLALAMEHRLEPRARLLLEGDALESDLIRARTQSRFYAASYYEVVYVGRDYVALKGSGTERFIPFQSIQQLYRSDKVHPTRSAPIRRSSGPSPAGSVPRGEATVQLEHVDPTEVAELIKKLFPEENLEIEPAGGAVRISFEGALGRRIDSLIRRLDVKFDE